MNTSLAKGIQRKMWGCCWMEKGTLPGVAEEAEILNTFFAIFTSKSRPQESLTQESRENIWRKKDFSLVKEEWVRDH